MSFITRNDVAHMLGVSSRQVRRYETRESDPLPVAEKGSGRAGNRYDAREAFEWSIRHRLRERGGVVGGVFINYQAERARLTKHQADHEALKVAELRAELVPTQLVIKAWQALVANSRAKLLAMPRRCSPATLAANNAPEVQACLESAIRDALSELETGEMPATLRAELDQLLGENAQAAANSPE